MPEAQSTNPFTNTRLMLAGIACGVIGAILAYMTINRKIEDATGGTTLACFLKKDIRPDEILGAHHVDMRPIPDVYLEGATRMLTDKRVNDFYGLKPYRAMNEGEPLSVHDFVSGTDDPRLVPPRAGCIYRALKVDSKGNPGRGLHRGSIVSLTGNFDLAVDSGGASDQHTLRLFEKIRVMMINGDPAINSVDKVNMMTVELSEEAAEMLTRLMPRMRGDFYVDVHAEQALASPPGQETSSEVKRLIREKLGASSSS